MISPSFTLHFPLADIPHWAARYDAAYDAGIEAMAPTARARGRLTLAELGQLGRWKSPRIGPRLAANDEAYVEAVTAVALTTPSEPLRIEVLTLLSGVGWPMASVVLHWCHTAPYPILDFRALWSLGVAPLPSYDFPCGAPTPTTAERWRPRLACPCATSTGRCGNSQRRTNDHKPPLHHRQPLPQPQRRLRRAGHRWRHDDRAL